MERINQILQSLTIVPLRQDVKEETIDIRRTARLKLPDSIIAATARVLGLPLVSADKSFERVGGIVLLSY
jgi:predicted nucleic acid-binding protein